MIRRVVLVVAHRVLLTVPVVRAEWHDYVVDSVSESLLPRVRMRGRSPHVAFYTVAGLEYAVRDSTGWKVDTVDNLDWYQNGNPALEFDRDGNLHVAWYRGTPWYARWDGAAWQ